MNRFPDENQSLLEFPCEIAVKAMGHNHPEFELVVVEIVRRHFAGLGEGAVNTRASRGGKYISVTVKVEAQNRPQIDALYRELSAHEAVVMLL